MRRSSEQSLIFGFQPSSHGFGWIAFSGPFSIHDWGLSDRSRGSKERCLRKIERLFERLSPHTIVLESFDDPNVKRSDRITQLCRAVVAMAHNRGMDVAIYAKGDVLACFASIGAKTRHEIACAVARSFEILRDRLPARRKAWEGSQRRMPLFDAAAVVLTHYQLGASTLFDDLLHDAPK